MEEYIDCRNRLGGIGAFVPLYCVDRFGSAILHIARNRLKPSVNEFHFSHITIRCVLCVSLLQIAKYNSSYLEH